MAETLAATDTKIRILDAAERLIAEHGVAGTSLRAVTGEAGVNLAAVNYHFGSKEALVEAVVGRIVAPINDERLRRLDALEAAPGEPSLEQLIDAFVGPIIDLLEREVEKGRIIARLLLRLLGDPGEAMQRIAIAQVSAVADRFLRAFGRALPHLSPEELWWRFTSMIAVVIFHDAFRLSTNVWPDFAPGKARHSREWMTRFLVAGMQAPPSPGNDGDD